MTPSHKTPMGTSKAFFFSYDVSEKQLSHNQPNHRQI